MKQVFTNLGFFIIASAIAILLVFSSSCSSTETVSRGTEEAAKVQEQKEKQAKKEYEKVEKKQRKEESDYARQLLREKQDRKKQYTIAGDSLQPDSLFNKAEEPRLK
jgi:Flp pilus assembly protein TadB